MGQSSITVVGELTEDANDQTANTSGTIVKDLNGKTCSLIKVETTQQGFSFDIGSSVAIVKIEGRNEKHPAEVWLWVPEGTRRLNIQHAQLGKTAYTFPLRTKAGYTYLMKVASGRTIVEEGHYQQYLKLRVEPKTAVVSIDGQSVMLDANGMGERYLEFGTHDVSATAANYHPFAQRVNINDPDNAQELIISMKPAFGWITVKDSAGIAGARVLIDDQEVGLVPSGDHGLKSAALTSGLHRLRVERKLYSPFIATIRVKDGVNTVVSPQLEANFATTKIVCSDPEADIYVNREVRGRGTWSGPLENGTYEIEARRAYHRSSRRTVTISRSNMGNEFSVNPPTPINGTVRISSQPLDAKVEIDGRVVGTTPFSRQILTGPHKLRLLKEGFVAREIPLTVAETGTTMVNEKLSSQCSFWVRTSEPEVYVTVKDTKGMQVASGKTPLQLTNVGVGKYTFTCNQKGFFPVNETIDCQGKDVMLKLIANCHSITIRSRYFPVYGTYVDGKRIDNSAQVNNYTIKMNLDDGIHSIKVYTYRYKGNKTFSVGANASNEIFLKQKYQYIVPNMFYIDLGAELFNGTNGIGGSIGFNTNNINVEAIGYYPLKSQHKFYITSNANAPSYGSAPLGGYINLKYSVGGRIGYSLKLNNRMQITPQVGVDYRDEEFGNAINGVMGARLFVGLSHHIGLQVSPQYSFVLSQSKDLKKISNVVQEVEKWNKGISMRTAIVFYW